MSQNNSAAILFTPLHFAAGIDLSHRLVLAPMTRCRSTFAPDYVPSDLVVDYYTQRATEGGLLFTEGVVVSPMSTAFVGAPGIWSKAQVAGWKRVVDSVHARGAYIFMQLWHGGRVGSSEYTPNHQDVVAPSAIEPHETLIAYATEDGMNMKELKATIPHELTIEEIAGVVAEFANGAANAAEAGFDGIELHGANGYLLAQFLSPGTNKRTDRYGGSVENRARILEEIVEACSWHFPRSRIGVHLSPTTRYNDVMETNAQETFTHVARALNRKVGFLQLADFQPGEAHIIPERLEYFTWITRDGGFTGHIIINGSLNGEIASEYMREGVGHLYSFGRSFLATPDLVEHVRRGLPLQKHDYFTWYVGGAKGYTDYSCTTAPTTAAPTTTSSSAAGATMKKPDFSYYQPAHEQQVQGGAGGSASLGTSNIMTEIR